jgi:hypothetical protein
MIEVKSEALTMEELHDQKVELLPDRVEMARGTRVRQSVHVRNRNTALALAVNTNTVIFAFQGGEIEF